MSTSWGLLVDPELVPCVRAEERLTGPVQVDERGVALDEPLRRAGDRMRQAPEPMEIFAAARAVYRRLGIDPTKTMVTPATQSALMPAALPPSLGQAALDLAWPRVRADAAPGPHA